MSGKRQAVNFKKLIDQMEDDKLSAGEWPRIVGGSCTEAELVNWLGNLDLSDLIVRIWEFTDRCTIGDDGPPGTAEKLERARLFGEGGDLDIRRNGNRFLWHYVGEADHAPEGETLTYPGTTESPVYCRERKSLLWGTREKEKEQWFDDRVSGAELTYFTETPALPGNVEERVKVKFREYTQAGRRLVVWLLKLEGHQEAKNG